MFIDENGGVKGLALSMCDRCQTGDCGNCKSLREWVLKRIGFEWWCDPEIELPKSEEFVIVIASGNPRANIVLEKAYELACYDEQDGWIFESYPEWEGATVHWWMPLPDAPEE